MLKIQKLNDEALEVISGGTVRDCEIEEKPHTDYCKLGILSGTLSLSIGIGIANDYAKRKRFKFRKKVKAILMGALVSLAADGIALSLIAGTAAGKKIYNQIKNS